MILPENKNGKLWILLIINSKTFRMHKYMFFCVVFCWLVSQNKHAFEQLLKLFLEKNNWFDISETTKF